MIGFNPLAFRGFPACRPGPIIFNPDDLGFRISGLQGVGHGAQELGHVSAFGIRVASSNFVVRPATHPWQRKGRE